MTSAELIKAGKLADARRQLVEEVKAAPSDAGKRTTLCQVLCLLGEWDKAKSHLDAIAVQNPAREAGTTVYKNLILAEQERAAVLHLVKKPSFLPKTPPYFEACWESLHRLSEGKPEEADAILEQIEGERPIASGSLDGAPFTGITDTDSFLSFFLEAMVHERYIWMPFESIRELCISQPKTLFDTIWAQGRITTWDGLTLNCFLPVLYAGSFAAEDDQIKLGRRTTWADAGGSFVRASGQHVFTIGENDIAILDIREVLFQPPHTQSTVDSRQ